MPDALNDRDDQPQSFVRLYEVAARAYLPEVEAEIGRFSAKARLREPAALVLRGLRSILQGDAAGGCALMQRAIEHEQTEARAYFTDLLVPVLFTRGALDDAETFMDAVSEPPVAIGAAFDAMRAAIAARRGHDAESRRLAADAFAAAGRADFPIVTARVMQRMSLAAFYREDYDEAHERGLEAARLDERLQAFRSAAGAYSVLYILSHSYSGDWDMARFYAERISLNGKRALDESMQNYGLVAQLHIAAESGDRRRLGSIRARLFANPMHEQFRERFAFVLSEALLAGWSGRFNSAAAALLSLRDGEVRFRGDRALATGLLALAAAANGQSDEARRLSRRSISESTQQRGPEAAFERRARLVARYVAAATCYLVGDSSRGVRALSPSFDPQGQLRASFGAEGVNADRLPRLMHGYALYIDAAFAAARRTRPAHGLTPVEVEVLRSLPTGETVAKIASERGKSKKTVERQLESIYAKLGARNRTEAINRGRESGLLG